MANNGERKRQIGGRCKHGHLLTAENFYLHPNGSGQCRACANEYMHKRRVELQKIRKEYRKRHD